MPVDTESYLLSQIPVFCKQQPNTVAKIVFKVSTFHFDTRTGFHLLLRKLFLQQGIGTRGFV